MSEISVKFLPLYVSLVISILVLVLHNELTWLRLFHRVWRTNGQTDRQISMLYSNISACFKACCMRCCADNNKLMPNTHRRRRRDETVESRRVGGVNTNSQLVGDSFVVSSVWTHASTVVNWVRADGCVVRSHRRIRRQSSRIHVHTADADATRQNCFVASASAVCIGL